MAVNGPEKSQLRDDMQNILSTFYTDQNTNI